MSESTNTAGLAGIVAGQTALSTVGKEGAGLTYRGYSIEDLAEHAIFEEVAWLLLYGELPKQSELDEFLARLQSQRGLPAQLKAKISASHPARPQKAPYCWVSARTFCTLPSVGSHETMAEGLTAP